MGMENKCLSSSSKVEILNILRFLMHKQTNTAQVTCARAKWKQLIILRLLSSTQSATKSPWQCSNAGWMNETGMAQPCGATQYDFLQIHIRPYVATHR